MRNEQASEGRWINSLDELERIHAPVFPFGLHYVGMRQQQDWLSDARTPVSRNQVIFLVRTGAVSATRPPTIQS